jgi:hypothetical protein
MLRKNGRIRSRVAALVAAAGLAAVASATFLGGPLTIVAPSEVIAGNPINGYVTGSEGMCFITSWTMGQGPNGPMMVPGLPSYGIGDPLYFTYQTFEFQAPGCFFVQATDSDETATVGVALK